MKMFKRGAVIVATSATKNVGYTDTTRTYKVVGNSKAGLKVRSLYYGTTHLFSPQYVEESKFVDIRSIPTTCKRVWKAFVQTIPTRTGDTTYMAKNQGYIHILYVTKSHIIGVSPDGHFRFLHRDYWNMDMFQECKAPKIDYAEYAKKIRNGEVATSC